MTTTTPTFWAIDGTPLQTCAYNVTTQGGTLYSPPPPRGSNLVIPHRAGQRWIPKQPDAKTMTFSMFVIGQQDDGSVSPNMQAMYNQNFRMLRSLFYQPRRQFALSKRWYTDPFDSGTLISATAAGEYAAGFEPAMNGWAGSSLSIDVLLADPFFYADTPLTQTFDLSTNISRTFTVPGDFPTDKIVITVDGIVTGPTFTTDDGVIISYSDTLSNGDSVAIDVDAWSAIYTPDVGIARQSAGYISHSGAVPWFELSPGTRTVTFTAESGSTGTATIAFTPKYLAT